MTRFKLFGSLMAVFLLAGCGSSFQTTENSISSIVKKAPVVVDQTMDDGSDHSSNVPALPAELNEAVQKMKIASIAFDSGSITGRSWKLIGSLETLYSHTAITNGQPAVQSTIVLPYSNEIILSFSNTIRHQEPTQCYGGNCPDRIFFTGTASVFNECEQINFSTEFNQTYYWGSQKIYQMLKLTQGASTSTICTSPARAITSQMLSDIGVDNGVAQGIPLAVSGNYLFVSHSNFKTYIFVLR